MAARLAGVDAWFGADKAGHFAACAAVTAAAWVLQQRAKAGGAARGRPRSRATRLALAVAAGLVVGLAKEALDAAGVRLHMLQPCCVAPETASASQLWPTGGAPSFRDFVADAAGSLAAAAVIAAQSSAPPAAAETSVAGTPLQAV